MDQILRRFLKDWLLGKWIFAVGLIFWTELSENPVKPQ